MARHLVHPLIRLWRLVAGAARAWSRAFRRLAPRLSAGLAAPVRPEPLLLQPSIELVRAHPGVAAELPGEAADDRLPHGDFTGADEAQRFAALPPIEPDALDDVDWDELARALTRNA